RQTKCVSGAVGEIESAVQRVRFSLRVFQARQARTYEAGKLLRVWRFLRENVSRTGETLKRRRGGHVPIQSPRVLVVRVLASRRRFRSWRASKIRRSCTP